jgi:hypothetical protein
MPRSNKIQQTKLHIIKDTQNAINTKQHKTDLFQTATGVLPCGDVIMTIQHNKLHKSHTQYTSHTNTYIIHSNTIKKPTKTETKQISSQSHTNSERHITANEYSVKKGEEIDP